MSKPVTLDRFIILMEKFMDALNLFNIRIDGLKRRIEKLEEKNYEPKTRLEATD